MLVATALVLTFVVVCGYLGWNEDVTAPVKAAVIVVAALTFALYIAVIWAGGPNAARGFRFGGEIYFAKDLRSSEADSSRRSVIPKWLREPILRLPVLVPIVCAAAAFAALDERVAPRSSEQAFQQASELTLLVELVGIVAVNAYFRVRGARVIDLASAIVTTAVLGGGIGVSLSALAGRGAEHGVQLVSASIVFGFVVLVMSALHGADASERSGPGRHERVRSPPKTGPPRRRIRPRPALRTGVTTSPRVFDFAGPTRSLLWVAAAILAFFLLLALVPAVLSLTKSATSLRVSVWGSVGAVSLASSAAFAVALAKAPPGPKAWRRLAGVIASGLITAVCGIAVADAQNRIDPPSPDCIAVYNELAALVHQESATLIAHAVMKDPRYGACGSPLRQIEQSALYKQGQTPTLPPSPSPYPPSPQPPGPNPTPSPPPLECVAYDAELDDLADDESVSIAEKAMAKDWRSPACDAPLAALAAR
ncbi:MAG: hypothetical protein WB709_11935 [Solirubrobacteraceae bacterium]